ncbi:MAG: hypothetical protein PHU53_01570 [Thermoplasmata archaeon]|nr:hypothetical protein [Thermoplasmata archaeon]
MSEFPLAAIARIPGLVIRLFFSALKFKRSAKKSARKLRKGMIKGGMDRALANQLASRYEESFSIRRFIGQATGEDAGFSSIFPFGR